MLNNLKRSASLVALAALVGVLTSSSAFAQSRAKQPVMTADSRITVHFIAPEDYTDLRESWHGTSDAEQAHLLEQFREHLRNRGEKVLAEGLHLTIRVLDIDLAGDFEPWRFRGNDDIRIVKDMYPARVHLAYELTDSTGTVLASGERRLNSFGMSGTVLPASDPLRYEKELLRHWLVAEFRQFRRD